MSKPIIGIVGKKFPGGCDYLPGEIIQYNTINKLIELNSNTIGILSTDKFNEIDEEVLALCDGFLFQGGSYIEKYHFKILDYAFKNKVPVLGICLGMQIIGIYSRDYSVFDLVSNYTTNNHLIIGANEEEKSKAVHNINIKKGTKIYDIFKVDRLSVNSRHKDCITSVGEDFIISSYSDDNIIESIETKDSEHFCIGVQWHPENIKEHNILFEKFIEACSKYKHKFDK